MSALSEAIYDLMTGDATLVGLLATYRDGAAFFTTDPPPGDATKPYGVSAGEVATSPWDTKTTEGREVYRDVRFYTDAGGSAVTVEALAERARALLHRQTLIVDGFSVIVAECSGPVQADEPDAYGRIVTIRFIMEEV